MVLNGIDFDQEWEGERGEGVSQNMAAMRVAKGGS